MDNLLYVLLTNVVVMLALICTIVLITVHIVRKRKFSLSSYLLLLIFIIGMYLFIPSRYTYLGFANQNTKMLENAIKLSINPYEKRLCNKYLAEIYADDIFHQGIKDGNKAINYMEKALKGEYKKYSGETTMLAMWYSIKGNYQKTKELNDILGTKQSLSLRNIYIMNNEYEKALETFSQNNKSVDNFLKAALYSELGKTEQAEKAEKIATQAYNNQIKNIKENYKQLEFKEKANKYKTINSYKAWLRTQAKEYKFD